MTPSGKLRLITDYIQAKPEDRPSILKKAKISRQRIDDWAYGYATMGMYGLMSDRIVKL